MVLAKLHNGLKLRLSNNTSGYHNVFGPVLGKWQTQTRINGRRYTFGRHDTAKEAAIAVAEGLKKFNAHIVPSRVPGVLTYRQVKDGEPVPDGEIVDVDEEEREEDIGSSSSAAAVVPRSNKPPSDFVSITDAEGNEFVTQADGLKLFLSKRSTTGYHGVYQNLAHSNKYCSQFGSTSAGNKVHLGMHDTALEAALAYAKHQASKGEQASKQHITTHHIHTSPLSQQVSTSTTLYLSRGASSL